MGVFRPLRSLTVTEFNSLTKSLLASSPDINDVWVRGEISNMTKHRSGHYYFTLKDEGSEIRCTLFRGTRSRLAFEPEENMKVLAFGSMDVYIKKGSYQFNVQDMRVHGTGDLHRAFEELRSKLEREGLFDPQRKRAIPKYPRCVGVVTSPTGAAIRDILNISLRRFPSDIILAPALVQGDDAADSIVRAISLLNRADVDVMIVGRGGGSLEDLWAFNEEPVARAIYASRTPIVSAVGHETDYTISDMVADLSAPTPSAAAELVFPDRYGEGRHIDGMMARARKGASASLDRMRHRFAMSETKLAPGKALERINHAYMDLDGLLERAQNGVVRSQEGMRARFRLSEARLNPRRAMDALGVKTLMLDSRSEGMGRAVKDVIGSARARLSMASASLEGLNPLSVLSRGYCVVTGGGNRTLSSVDDMEVGEDITVRMRDGSLEVTVERKVRG